ncbi:pentapeptide repeat-containing protein [Streptomyces wuyuanensis]|uniref:pentapeptide repeat-containing protein n=1 Tax=Streptomyces wuyuanensis TaxID=1196353 RepID=UPI003440D67C
MSSPSPDAPPPWPHCGSGADTVTDPVGCRGIHVPGHTACLAHLSNTERTSYLAGLTPGAHIDHRGTPFTPVLLHNLLEALRNPTTRKPDLGDADFGGAHFSGDGDFGGAHFSGDTNFSRAQFLGPARFGGVQFAGPARFGRVHFSSSAWFGRAHFSDLARFGDARFSSAAQFVRAHFSGPAWFDGTQFSGVARFGEAHFSGVARFGEAHFLSDAGYVGARFSGAAQFIRAQFSGLARFGGAQFSDEADFHEARFSGGIDYSRAEFSGDAGYAGALFSEEADFHEARFSGSVDFGGSQFFSHVTFVRAQFSGEAGFDRAGFSGDAWFDEAKFSGDTWFDEAKFSGNTRFADAQFLSMSRLGPLVCAKTVHLSGAVFAKPVTLEISAVEVLCERTHWESTASLRLRYASVDLSHAVLSSPVAVTAHPKPFDSATASSESLLAGNQRTVRVTSVRGVDAAHLMLTDADLRDCVFAGAFHLDQLRLEGRCTFSPTPRGLHRHRIWPYWWSRRRTLAEEHHWRARAAGQPTLPSGQALSPRDWRTGPHHPDPDQTPAPEDVAALYRQLRKAFEDGKNEPGAADFYYGEMEMRRHDRISTPPSERALLWGYWLLSGYGLRASRALAWLVTAVAATIVLMMGLGLPDSSPKQTATGTVPAGGGPVALTVDKPDPKLTLAFGERFTGQRFDKALRVVVNSVVFRSSGQDLTTWGTYTEMISRFTEPVLLALAILAMRSRIKR